jgi:hypothetical protein
MRKSLARACLLLVLLLLAAGCERPATRSNWSPIEDANHIATAEALPVELTGSPTQPAETAAPGDATPEVMGTLDASQLPGQLPDSMKGYELYSWQAGEEWNFTLITGTNRNKSFEEIIAPENSYGDDGFLKLSVTGVAELKKVLDLLPSGEDIFWGGMDLGGQVPSGTVYLTLPPQSIVDEVSQYCSELGLHLTSIQ